MATESDTGARGVAGKLLLPLAATVVGTALGFVVTQRQKLREAAPKLREAVSDLPRPHAPESGVGDLAGELREKVDSVLGKEPEIVPKRPTGRVDHARLEQRRRARAERRNRRRQSSRR